MGDMIISLTIV